MKCPIQKIPTSILVLITSNLHLQDLLSLRCINNHFRNTLNSQRFWRLFYSQTYKKTLLDDILWKDLLLLDSLVQNLETNPYIVNQLQENIIGPYLGLCQYIPLDHFKPSLIEIYLKLQGVDIIDSSIDPQMYLWSLLELSPLDEQFSDQKPKSFVNATRVAERGAELIMKTPSRRFFIRLFNLIKETDKEMNRFYSWMNNTSTNDIPYSGGQSQKYFVEYLIKGIAHRISSIGDSNLRNQISIMGIEPLLEKYMMRTNVITNTEKICQKNIKRFFPDVCRNISFN